MEEHTVYLNRCKALAAQAAINGETAVGSIVVRDGQILGEGIEMSKQLNDVTRHAEVVAILDAIKNYGDCIGATIYSNVEPCLLCSYVIRHHQIAAVIFSTFCGELGGTNPKYNVLTTSDIKSWGKTPTILNIE